MLDVIRTVERVTGARVPYRVTGRRPGDPAALFASNARICTELGWTPGFGDIQAIVETAWRWHTAHPRGYAGHH